MKRGKKVFKYTHTHPTGICIGKCQNMSMMRLCEIYETLWVVLGMCFCDPPRCNNRSEFYFRLPTILPISENELSPD